MVNENQIKYFLPLHELDGLTSTTPGKPLLSADDLFLISQVSAYATNESNAVTVSKKLRYGDLANAVSSDLSIAKMRNDIWYIATNRIPKLSSELSETSSLLSGTIDSLSATVDKNFIKKFGPSTHSTITTRTQGGETELVIADRLYITDGDISNIRYTPVKDIFNIAGQTIANGIVNGEVYENGSISSLKTDTNAFKYTTTNPCYFTVSLSAIEDDSSPAPLQMVINPDAPKPVVVSQFNNTGSF